MVSNSQNLCTNQMATIYRYTIVVYVTQQMLFQCLHVTKSINVM